MCTNVSFGGERGSGEVRGSFSRVICVIQEIKLDDHSDDLWPYDIQYTNSKNKQQQQQQKHANLILSFSPRNLGNSPSRFYDKF